MKKLLIVALALVLLLPGCATTVLQRETVAPTVAASAAPAETLAATVESSQEPTTEPTVEPTAAATGDFKTAEINIDNVEAAIKGLFKDGEYKGTSTEVSGETSYVTIYFRPASFADEKDFTRQAGYQAALAMEVLFTNEKVSEVWFRAQADLKNDSGDVEEMDAVTIIMSKEQAVGINWAKLKEQASTDYNAMLDAAMDYELHPDIMDKINR